MYSSSPLLRNQLYTFYVAQHDIMAWLAGILGPDIVFRTQGWGTFFSYFTQHALYSVSTETWEDKGQQWL